MKQKTAFTLHTSALTALFILGNGVIIFPTKNADEFNFLGYLITAVTSFLLYLALSPVINRLYTEKNSNINPYKKYLLAILYFFTAALTLSYAANTFANFILFANSLLLQNYPLWVAALLFLLAIVFFALRRQEDFLKFTLIAFCFAFIIIIFFFLASLKRFDFNNIIILKLPKLKVFLPQLKEYFLNPLLPLLLIAVYESCVFNKVRLKASLSGIVLGVVLLGICILNSVLLFGPRLAAMLDYPYASSVSTVTIGRLFTRLDGFSYFIYFSACLTKITVCLFLVTNLLKKTNKILK